MKKESPKTSFGSVAKEYKKWRGGYPKKLYDLIFLSSRNNLEDTLILDVGCGVGNSTEPLVTLAKKKGIRTKVIGSDPDDRMLVEARKSAKANNLPIEYIKAEAEKLPFLKDSFDIAISGAAFHWFANQRALKSIKRILKTNGTYFAFWNLNVESSKPTIGLEYYKKYKAKGIPKKLRDADTVKKMFRKAGFRKVQSLKLPFVEKKTIEETIGCLTTNSAYAILSPRDRRDFVKGMTKAYKGALRGKNIVTEKREIVVVYGIK